MSHSTLPIRGGWITYKMSVESAFFRSGQETAEYGVESEVIVTSARNLVSRAELLETIGE